MRSQKRTISSASHLNNQLAAVPLIAAQPAENAIAGAMERLLKDEKTVQGYRRPTLWDESADPVSNLFCAPPVETAKI